MFETAPKGDPSLGKAPPRYINEVLGGIKLALEGLTLDADGVVTLSSAERRLLMRLLTACQAYRESLQCGL